jgi:hydrogenase/urease accessory protein HupE
MHPVTGLDHILASGFIAASATLLVTGAFLGRLLTMTRQPKWLRACGGAIAAAAFLLAIA